MINIEKLRNYSQVKKYETGTVFSRNGLGSEMYVVLQGEVAILNSYDNKVISTIGPGELFNESILFSSNMYPITSLAITDVIALPISKIHLPSFIVNEPNFVIELMKAMYERFEIISNDFESATGYKWAARKPLPNTINSAQHVHKTCIEVVPEQIPPKNVSESNIEPQIVATHTCFELFPEGHTGNYELALTSADNIHMCEIEYTCPICNSKFKGLKILSSRLATSSTDNDMRRHYKNIEPIYYEVITCPNCLFSALASIFDTAESSNTGFEKDLKAMKVNINFKFGTKPDTAAIYAAYYLALFCASKCFSKYQLVEAKLLQRLSWLYHDSNDEQMELRLARQSLEKYLQSYSELNLSAEQEIQTCIIIGELYVKFGNYKEARNFYYKAKTNNFLTPVMRRRCENRLDELKELDHSQK